MVFYEKDLDDISKTISRLAAQANIKRLMLKQQEAYRELDSSSTIVYSKRLAKEPELIEQYLNKKVVELLKTKSQSSKVIIIRPTDALFWEASLELDFLVKVDQTFLINLNDMSVTVQYGSY